MKSLNALLLLLVFTVMGTSLNAQQRNCSTMDHLEYQKQLDPKLDEKMDLIHKHTNKVLESQNRVTGTITIPVVVHVIYNNSTENISDAQVQSQIDILNEDFRRLNSDADGTWPQAVDSEIEFCLASTDPLGNPTTGITRTSTSVSSFSANDAMKFNSSGGKDAWPSSDYMNFWICDLGGGLLGYAQFPGGNPATDGVVCDYQYVGNIGTATAPFNLGRTGTHEVGHWLNLRHIWGDGNCSFDDFVSDTPNSDNPNYSCPIGHVSCSSTDMVQNYMDYTDDACMNLFTDGQKNRMRALFNAGGARESLLNSAGCGAPPGNTCNNGVQDGNETGVDCGGSCPNACPCTDNDVTLTINLDNYPEETSWEITAGSTVVASGGTYGSFPDGSTVTEDLCLADGCYTFTIFDSYGDGICCAYGSGSYTLTDGSGNTLASGGSFGSSESTPFCVTAGGGGPTCSDGVQNGDETGVDCGGSNCPACPTCDDGVQNGDETDVDCGGSNCPACPTCDDGIQNGDETGVDCGGSCAPCGGGGCSYVTIDSWDFEGGWGIWNDGGSDCRRSSRDAAYAQSGTFCVRIRDDSGSSVMTSDPLNLSAYDELTVDFNYITQGMDNSGEGFWLEYSSNGGSSYQSLYFWNLNDEFVNGTAYSESLVITGTFSSNSRIRFRNDASANGDRVYIDDVVISGCLNSSREQEVQTVVAENTDQAKLIEEVELTEAIGALELFPNPTRDQLNVQFQLNEPTPVQLIVTDLTGKVVTTQNYTLQEGPHQVQVDASRMQAGFYLVHLIAKEQRIAKKFVVAK
jgi:hypothetical protein